MPGPTAIEKRMERIEQDAEAHRRDDLNQFGQLRNDIAKLGNDLGQRIDSMASDLQGQIDKFTLDKVRAEGESAGLAKAAVAYEKARTPNPWLLAIAPAVAALLLGYIVSWGIRDHIQGGLGSQDRTTTTVSTVIPDHGVK